MKLFNFLLMLMLLNMPSMHYAMHQEGQPAGGNLNNLRTLRVLCVPQACNRLRSHANEQFNAVSSSMPYSELIKRLDSLHRLLPDDIYRSYGIARRLYLWPNKLTDALKCAFTHLCRQHRGAVPLLEQGNDLLGLLHTIPEAVHAAVFARLINYSGYVEDIEESIVQPLWSAHKGNPAMIEQRFAQAISNQELLQLFKKWIELHYGMQHTQCIQTIGASCSGHTDWVRALAYMQERDQFISGSDDNTIKIWQCNEVTGLWQCIQTIDAGCGGHTNWVRALAYMQERDQFISGSYGTIKIWQCNKATGIWQCRQTIDASCDGHTNWVSVLAYMQERDQFVSGSGSVGDGTIQIWQCNEATGLWRCIQTIDASCDGHTDWVEALAYMQERDQFVSGSFDNTIKIWQCKETTGPWQCIQTIDRSCGGHTNWVRALAYMQERDQFVSGSDDHTIKIWRPAAFQELCCRDLKFRAPRSN